MKIWMLNNYTMLPEHGHLMRHYNLGYCLKMMGHDPVVFAGSHPHNTSLQLINGKEQYLLYQEHPFPWIMVKTWNYEGSRLKQVLSMFQFYFNAKKAAKWALNRYGTPNVILGSSAHPLTALLAVQLGKKYDCRVIAEIRDLWPESIVAYGIAGPHHPAVIALRWLEKWIYKKADDVVFTMEGAYDYIVEQGWEQDIPQSKVHYINNGIDLELFDYNRSHFQIEDPDLEDPNIFKVVYTGSIRKVNDLGALLDVAKKITDPRIKLLIWGTGDELPMLCQRILDEGIKNVLFKGHVEKKYIPFIVSCADANLIHSGLRGKAVLRFGISANKMFDCLAAGKPVLMDFSVKYNPLTEWDAGISLENPEQLPQAVQYICAQTDEAREEMGRKARHAAEQYDFKRLTEKLLNVIAGKTP